jgi:hypothetical protein
LLSAFVNGLGRVTRAPALIVGMWSATLLSALPLAFTLRGMLADHLGGSLAADTAAAGVNYDWWNEFLAQAAGVGQTFVPAIIGFAAVLKNLSMVADAHRPPTVIAAAVAIYMVASIFLSGGVLDRLARDRRIGSHGFFAACGAYFFRLLRLGVIATLVYFVLFTSVHDTLVEQLGTRMTRNVTVERTAFLYRLLLYFAFGIVVIPVNIWFDYAKVRMVVEDRRSAIGALNAAWRFLARNLPSVVGLYAIDMLAFIAVLALYALAAPGAAGGISAWIGFLVGQLYIALRVGVRLLFAASEIALFQSRLAHAGYVTASAPVWPDSPAAEAIRPETSTR